MYKKLFSLLALTLLAFSSTSVLGTKALAISGADWKAGRIIDDFVFTHKDSMSASDIQGFLAQKVGTDRGNPYSTAGFCDTNGVRTSELGGGTRAQYGAAHGNPAPFTCLRDYYEVPKTDPGPGVPASNYGGAAIPAGAQSAAEIIWNAAQRYSINPKVLLVMIQKESAGPLITDDWPFRTQYTYAMGAHCPDGPNGAQCDGNYAGFSMQIHESARLLRYYLDNMQQPWWSYKKPYQVNNILWNTTYTGCGGSNVYIESKATAGLYTYTPYQPNQAALNNLYGTGDGCSAYGNRNFWRMFHDWFGTTYNANYLWQYQGQAVYTDSSKTTAVDVYNQALMPNTRYYFTLAARNVGNMPWTRSSTNLATSNPADRGSPLYDSTWLGSTRPARLIEETVAPGDVGTFEFWVKTPNTITGSREYFNLVVEGVAWMNDIGLFWPINSVNYSWQYQGQGVYTNSSKTTPVDSYNQALAPNTRYYFTLSAKNVGNVVWNQSTVRLGTFRGADRGSLLYDSTWLGGARPASMLESSVAPGQTANFEFWVKTPTQPINAREYFSLVAEGLTWMNDPGQNWVLNPASYSWQYQGQTVYTNSSKTTAINSYTQTLAPNTAYYLTLAARNTGNVAWQKNSVRLGTFRNADRNSQIYDVSWLGTSRTATLVEDTVAPGDIGNFEFWVRTPNTSVDIKEYFNLVVEGITWMNDLGLNWVIRT